MCMVVLTGKIETVLFCDYLEDGDSKLVGNVGSCIPINMASFIH